MGKGHRKTRLVECLMLKVGMMFDLYSSLTYRGTINNVGEEYTSITWIGASPGPRRYRTIWIEEWLQCGTVKIVKTPNEIWKELNEI